MVTEIVEVATESEEEVRFRYSGKKFDAVCGFLAYFCAVLRFLDLSYALLTEATFVTANSGYTKHHCQQYYYSYMIAG